MLKENELNELLNDSWDEANELAEEGFSLTETLDTINHNFIMLSLCSDEQKQLVYNEIEKIYEDFNPVSGSINWGI